MLMKVTNSRIAPAGHYQPIFKERHRKADVETLFVVPSAEEEPDSSPVISSETYDSKGQKILRRDSTVEFRA